MVRALWLPRGERQWYFTEIAAFEDPFDDTPFGEFGPWHDGPYRTSSVVSAAPGVRITRPAAGNSYHYESFGEARPKLGSLTVMAPGLVYVLAGDYERIPLRPDHLVGAHPEWEPIYREAAARDYQRPGLVSLGPLTIGAGGFAEGKATFATFDPLPPPRAGEVPQATAWQEVRWKWADGDRLNAWEAVAYNAGGVEVGRSPAVNEGFMHQNSAREYFEKQVALDRVQWARGTGGL